MARTLITLTLFFVMTAATTSAALQKTTSITSATIEKSAPTLPEA